MTGVSKVNCLTSSQQAPKSLSSERPIASKVEAAVKGIIATLAANQGRYDSRKLGNLRQKFTPEEQSAIVNTVKAQIRKATKDILAVFGKSSKAKYRQPQTDADQKERASLRMRRDHLECDLDLLGPDEAHLKPGLEERRDAVNFRLRADRGG